MSNIWEHSDGKMKPTASIFGFCVVAFLSSFLLIFGIGGGVGISVGIALCLVSLVLGVVFGFATVAIYLDWLDNG